MRLWSLSPEYLDRQGLLAVWREGLLAKKVLAGKTKGYKNHPQLIRFKASGNPKEYINRYLLEIYQEARRRGYRFSLNKIGQETDIAKGLKKKLKNIKVNNGQADYEFQHLLIKLKIRDKNKYRELKNVKHLKLNAIFKKAAGKIEKWEKIK